MNINQELVNRALLDVGQSPLTTQDISDENTNYDLCKRFYLETFLEALSEAPWAGGRKRAKLVRTGRPNLPPRGYRFAYDLPFDCSRPIELQGNEYFVAEDRLIYTNADHAELLYVSNGKIMRPVAAIRNVLGGIPDMEYITAGPPGADPDVTFRAGGPGDLPYSGANEIRPPGWPAEGEPPAFGELDENGEPVDFSKWPPIPFPDDPVSPDDYPDYMVLEYEPKFYEYIEKMLAAKFTMKLSNQPQLKTQMLQEALLIKQEATNTSLSQRAAQLEPQKWWKEELGL
jgi:hypothetical protein